MESFIVSRIWVGILSHTKMQTASKQIPKHGCTILFFTHKSVFFTSFYKKQKQRKVEMQPFTGLENSKQNKIKQNKTLDLSSTWVSRVFQYTKTVI